MEYVIVALIVAAVAFVAFRKRKRGPFEGKPVVEGGADDRDNRDRKDLF